MLKIDDIKFDEKGLVPAVVVDATSKKVLTVAFMNRESLSISLQEGPAPVLEAGHRQKLWRKGEESGNVQAHCGDHCRLRRDATGGAGE
jgi:phosphoribosyl-ATP pyrophosphohydrolase/phosphoribosyl-AMP cyclohydrolase